MFFQNYPDTVVAEHLNMIAALSTCMEVPRQIDKPHLLYQKQKQKIIHNGSDALLTYSKIHSVSVSVAILVVPKI